ncbi:MAG TPA: response regulator [Thermoanaerobaculia bacterium]|nr:response regulator [Thermoanaerobaculia bacterium]
MLTILIVDDNPSFRASAARLCQAEGFSTVTAGDLHELSQVLGTSKPDLVLVDIELPTIPGHRLGALIRSRHQVPIVLISALSEDRLRRLFEASDADGWICKPLTRDKLIAAVTRFVTKQKPEASSTARTQDSGAAFRVLLVEDEPIIASRIESALASIASVTSVTDGDAAIECLVNNGRFGCILLDLTLPHLSGFDVLRHLMLHQPESLKNTIVMTAATDESLQFIDPGAVAGLLRKPFQIGALAEMVEGISRR